MTSWHVTGTPDEIMSCILDRHPGALSALTRAAELVPWSKRQIAPYQAAVLYALAGPFNHPGASVIEVGTAQGYSAVILGLAADRGDVLTLNPKGWEVDLAREHLRSLRNVCVMPASSDDYRMTLTDETFDLIFVDGSHLADDVRADCQWFNWLKTGGLILFHDYSPEGSARPTPEVYAVLKQFWQRLGREPDVLVVDDRQTGMIGWYRKEGERYDGHH